MHILCTVCTVTAKHISPCFNQPMQIEILDQSNALGLIDLYLDTSIRSFDCNSLRTVSNVVIYVCDKYVTNIDKIISVGLDLSFRAHSLPSASRYCLRTSANIS